MNKIEEYVNQYENRGTINSYRCYLNNYFKIIKQKPETYFEKERDYQKDVKKYWDSTKGKAPLTRSQGLSCIKLFLQEHDVELKTKFLNKLKRRTKGNLNRPISLDRVPNQKQLKEILQQGSIKDRALFLLSSSSGMRIDAILKLKPGYIDWESDPVMINIPGGITKTGQSRVSFITPEAAEALQAWLKIRDDYLKLAVKKCNHKNTPQKYRKDPNDETIFPFNYTNSREMWNKLINKAGFTSKDTSTGRYQYHIHSLRKYFRTRLAAEIPVDVVEEIMGHSGYLTSAYRRYSLDDLKRFYLKGMHTLTVFESPQDLSEINESLQQKDEQITSLQKEVESLNKKLADIDSKILHKLVERELKK